MKYLLLYFIRPNGHSKLRDGGEGGRGKGDGGRGEGGEGNLPFGGSG